MKLSVVIPAYNEAARIGPTLEKTLAYFKSREEAIELIVADDGSADSTRDVVRSWEKKSPYVRLVALSVHKGKGGTVKEGVLEATGDLVLISDADLAAPIEEWDKLKTHISQGYDGAVGTRALRDDTQVKQSALRTLSSRVFNFLVTVLVLKGFSDTQCGFKLFTRPVIQELCREQRLDGFSFDIELLYLATKRGYRIKEVPINWAAQPGSKVRIFSDSIRMILDILKIRQYHG